MHYNFPVHVVYRYSVSQCDWCSNKGVSENVNTSGISFEELMDMDITSVSKKEEKQFTAPASVYVISNEDIRRSGHQSIPEVLRMVLW